MKALIFNSGLGRRMGELTERSHKSLVPLGNGESIFARQLRILKECGISEVIVTTGPYADQLKAVTEQPQFAGMTFRFVQNDRYDTTNYIYSAYLAREWIDDDFLTLHGDLVFHKPLVQALLQNPAPSACLVNASLPQPEKDFKGRVQNGKLTEVGIHIFDEDCYALQPLYKLSKQDCRIWMNAIVDFVENRNCLTVYAENAFNEVSHAMNVSAMSYEGYYINEIDNLEDYVRVKADIARFDYREQEIEWGAEALPVLVKRESMSRPLVVLDSFLKNDERIAAIESVCRPIYFSAFSPNPTYEDVVAGLQICRENGCDGIVSVGGGSAIDTAKAIKLFYPMQEDVLYLEQPHKYSRLPHIAMPTTAGTGSESTRYAAIYYRGVKQSLTDDGMLPTAVVAEPGFLKTLPAKQRAATLADALCQAIEAMWSVNSCEESEEYAQSAIRRILHCEQGYFAGNEAVYAEIMTAANEAGKAINLTQTTAAHAMSYKVTSLFAIPHGQAVAMTLPALWTLLDERCEQTFDPRGSKHLRSVLDKLNELFDCQTTAQSVFALQSLLTKWGLDADVKATEEQKRELVQSVNPLRLQNFPVALTKDEIAQIYETGLKKGR